MLFELGVRADYVRGSTMIRSTTRPASTTRRASATRLGLKQQLSQRGFPWMPGIGFRRGVALATVLVMSISASGAIANTARAERSTRPNIVFILADDKCDSPGEMSAKEAGNAWNLVSRPDLQIAMDYGEFIWIEGN